MNGVVQEEAIHMTVAMPLTFRKCMVWKEMLVKMYEVGEEMGYRAQSFVRI
jgi:hypothetical protein